VAAAAGGLPRIGRGLCGALGRAAPYLGGAGTLCRGAGKPTRGRIIHSPCRLCARSPLVRSEPARKGRSRAGEVSGATKPSLIAHRAILQGAACEAVRGRQSHPCLSQRSMDRKWPSPRRKRPKNLGPFHVSLTLGYQLVTVHHASVRGPFAPQRRRHMAAYKQPRCCLRRKKNGEHP